MQLLGIFSPPPPLLSICRRNAAISSALIYGPGVSVIEEGCCTARALASGAGGSHLSSLVLEPHLHHPDAQPRLRSQGLPHLKAPTHTFPAARRERGRPSKPTSQDFSSSLIFFFSFFFLEGKVERRQRSLGPADYGIKALAREQHSYLSMTFGAASHRPASANTDQSAAPHFKAEL